MDYEAHLKGLRESYYRSYPRQRLGVARQRIENPSHGPNLLVTYVSAIEGLLRSLVVWGETIGERPNEETYVKYQHWGVGKLYKKYLKQQNCNELVEASTYRLIGYAVEYRNLLAHECTYLGQDKYPDLLDACEELLQAISAHAGI